MTIDASTARPSTLDAQVAEPASEPCSVFERVMENPKSRNAYFNTTRGILTGDPDQAETIETRALLGEKSVAHLFTADPTLPQPMFYADGFVRIGNEEIASLAHRISA